MLCSELLSSVAGHPALAGHTVTLDEDVELTYAVHDSRKVTSGSLFCCIQGAVHDGHDHAPAAVAAGASALLCQRPLNLGVPEIRVESVRHAIGPVAAALAGCPSEHMALIGVTGTNGKTTTVSILASIFEAAGLASGVIGTLTGTRTTPEAPELQARLANLLSDGAEAVAMEVSSHALDLHRVDGTRFAVVVFLNLSRDHLDHHGTMEDYFRAKARLFERDFADRAVIGIDDPRGRLISDTTDLDVATFGLDDVEDLVMGPAGSTFKWQGLEIETPLPGRFNVSNVLAAASSAREVGIADEAIVAGIAACGNVPGRFERIDEGQAFVAAVDFAHTPDGLEQLLETAAELTTGRVIVVFGAGGSRDPHKRPHMGEVAARLADLIVLTSDNPRDEDPQEIIEDLRRGMEEPTETHIEVDRRAAIALGVSLAEPGDLLLVAGKGHERTQTTGNRSVPFDDREELRKAIRRNMEATT